MSNHTGDDKSLPGSIIGGAVGGGVLWWVVNGMMTVNGVGWLERQGGPLGAVWAGAAAGAVVGGIGWSVGRTIRRSRSEGLAEAAERSGMVYAEDASAFLDRHEGLRAMPIFEDLSRAADLTAGVRDGREFGAFELTTVSRSRSSDSSPSTRRRTVVVVPGAGLPAFDLGPRGMLLNLAWPFLGVDRLTFDPEAVPDPHDAEVIRLFGRRFFVARPHGQEEDEDSGEGGAIEPGRESDRVAELRRLLPVPVMRRLLESPGWSIQSRGGHLALSRPIGGGGGRLSINGMTITVPIDRPGRLGDRAAEVDQAMAIARELEDASRSTGPVVPAGAGEQVGVEDARASRSARFALSGAGGGFFAGFAVFATIMFNADMEPGPMAALMLLGLPLCAFGGLALGAFGGARLARILPDPEPVSAGAEGPSGLIGCGPVAGAFLGFMLGGASSMGLITGLEWLGVGILDSGVVPLVFFGGPALGLPTGVLLGSAISDRLARMRARGPGGGDPGPNGRGPGPGKRDGPAVPFGEEG